MTTGAQHTPRGTRPTAEQIASLRAFVGDRGLDSSARKIGTSPTVLGKILDGAHVSAGSLERVMGRVGA
jgi:hypothetical protein